MSERKVLNKYYPPDFDPSKIPRAKRPKNSTFNIRLMAPFNMRCNTCGEYIYKGKKFNSRKETVDNMNYLGLHIYRFYIKCPMCIAEISFRTDPQNTDYEIESGATRNFEALRTAEKMAEKEEQMKKDEESNNPMKLLENRTAASRREMNEIEALEDLKRMKSNYEQVSIDEIIDKNKKLKTIQEEMEDEEAILREQAKDFFKRLKKTESSEEPPNKVVKTEPPKKQNSLTKQFDKAKEMVRLKMLARKQLKNEAAKSQQPPVQTELSSKASDVNGESSKNSSIVDES